MNQIQDIMVMSNLKLVDLLYAQYSTTDKEITAVKLDLLKILGYKATEHDLKIIESDYNPALKIKSRLPKKGQYVNAFIEMGFTHAQIGEWFEMTPAAVSWHKMNPSKSEYKHKYLENMRMLTSGQIKDAYKPSDNL